RRRDADAARLQAQQARDAARRALYGQQVARAFFEWQTCNILEAKRLLEAARTERPGWEWAYVRGLCHSDLLSLGPHADTGAGVAYSPDAGVLAAATGAWSGRNPGEIRLWDAESGRLLRTMGGGRHAPFMDLAFSPDGRQLATAGVPFRSGLP